MTTFVIVVVVGEGRFLVVVVVFDLKMMSQTRNPP